MVSLLGPTKPVSLYGFHDDKAYHQGPTYTSKQPIRTHYLGHVIGYQPIRDQYFLHLPSRTATGNIRKTMSLLSSFSSSLNLKESWSSGSPLKLVSLAGRSHLPRPEILS
eukprot:sb/3477332/